MLEDFVRWYSPRDWIDEEEDLEDVKPVKVTEDELEKDHPTDGWEVSLDEDWNLVDPALCESRLPPPAERVSCQEGVLLLTDQNLVFVCC